MKRECKNLEYKIWLVSFIHILLFVIMCLNAKVTDVGMKVFFASGLLLLIVNLFSKLIFYWRDYFDTIECTTVNCYNTSNSFFFKSFKYSRFMDDYIDQNKYSWKVIILAPLLILNVLMVLFYVALLFMYIIVPCLVFIFKYI